MNLEHLRRRLTSHLAALLLATSALAIWSLLPRPPLPARAFWFWAGMLGLAAAARVALARWPRVARHLLVWGLLAGLGAAMAFFAEPWLPFFGLLLTLAGAVLVPGGDVAAAVITGAAAAALTYTGTRSYPLRDLLLALALGAVLARLVVRTLYTALQWAWSMQERADQLLETARGRQAELNRTLKSLELAYELQRSTQQELVAARRRAEEARRLKEQFAANISHELRTPLNLILGFSEVMHLSPEVYGGPPWPDALREDIYQVYRSSSHLLEMIDDILDLSRFEMTGFTLRREPTCVESLLRGAAEIAADFFRASSAELRVDVDADLPVLEIDRTRIRQVLLNLLKNAQRFTSAGSVRLEARRAGSEVVISVRDTGLGIPAEKLPYIFDEFYQVDQSLSRSQQGAGLGLAICKRFVEAHEGRIWAESVEGAGSTFSFALPVPGQHALAPHLLQTGAAGAAERPALPPILLVERDRAVVSMVRRHMGEHEVVQVEDAASLAAQVAALRPRAVVYSMPPGGADGPVEAACGGVPLVECTLPSQAWVADEMGVIGCLTKPVTARDLLTALAGLRQLQDVLLVDDDRGLGRLVQRLLQTAGAAPAVRQAYDGAEGLAAMGERRPDVVLLDLTMPGMDGLQLLKAMRERVDLASVPVLLLTATSLAEDLVARCGSRLVVQRAGGLGTAQMLRCLRALIGALDAENNAVACPPPANPL